MSQDHWGWPKVVGHPVRDRWLVAPDDRVPHAGARRRCRRCRCPPGCAGLASAPMTTCAFSDVLDDQLGSFLNVEPPAHIDVDTAGVHRALIGVESGGVPEACTTYRPGPEPGSGRCGPVGQIDVEIETAPGPRGLLRQAGLRAPDGRHRRPARGSRWCGHRWGVGCTGRC